MPEGYDTVVGERGFTLSGGQRQRIAIARTLVVNPPILVLDDATSAIDVQIEQQIHAALSDLMEGRTTLIIAHRLSTISLADRVAVVEDGRVIAQGTHAELLEREPRYAEILAQTEEDAKRRAEEQETARARAGAHRRAAALARDRERRRQQPRSRRRRRRARRLRPRARAARGDGLMAWGGGGMMGGGGAVAAAAWSTRGTRAAACRSPGSRRRCRSGSRSCSTTSRTGRRPTARSRTG